MKALFWLVLFVNILFFTWQVSVDEEHGNHAHTHADEDKEQTLQLLAEREALQAPTRTEKKETIRAAPVRSGSCYALGPFRGLEEASGAVMQLKARGLDGRTRKTEERVPKGYWVYLPPSNSRDSAKDRLREMHRANIDSFLMTKGPKANAISVGIYNDRGHALERTEELQRKGFDVVMEERYSEKTQFWVDLSLQATSQIDDETRRRIAIEFPGQRFEPVPCG